MTWIEYDMDFIYCDKMVILFLTFQETCWQRAPLTAILTRDMVIPYQCISTVTGDYGHGVVRGSSGCQYSAASDCR